MTARDHRTWLEDTPAGRFTAREGITVSVDHDQAEQIVEQTRRAYRHGYGRELHPDELRRVRAGAELRSLVAAGGLQHESAHEIARAHGWGVVVPPRGQGMAMRGPDGAWQGDPAVAEATQRAEDERLRLAEASYTAWRRSTA